MRSAEEAARRAKECFLQNANMYFGCSIETDGKLQDTWLLKHNGEWHRIPREPNQFTHVITNAQNGSKAEARVQFLCDGRWMDPSEVPGDGRSLYTSLPFMTMNGTNQLLYSSRSVNGLQGTKLESHHSRKRNL